jgi:hypothetical protein
LQLFRFGLHRLAFGFQRVEALDVKLVAARLQSRRDGRNILA